MHKYDRNISGQLIFQSMSKSSRIFLANLLYLPVYKQKLKIFTAFIDYSTFFKISLRVKVAQSF
jgi:hypothetical protein